jgi:1-deoxy-D-xylulose-5-phosphate reductoisomerase
LVVSGDFFMQLVEQSGTELLPIDSEHNAIFQCMPGHDARDPSAIGVDKVLLTASGGACRDVTVDQLTSISPEQACRHPNWSMGRKVSVDSATMMNKGLELIEACRLFAVAPEKVEIVLHPQSIVHSMVQYLDGSVLAQMSNPDMRTAIAHALAWPERIESGVEPLDLVAIAHLDFSEPDMSRYPCLRLARDVVATGGTSPAIMNAANEVAVDAFLERQIMFTDIARLVEATLEQVAVTAAESINDMLSADIEARRFAKVYVTEVLSA